MMDDSEKEFIPEEEGEGGGDGALKRLREKLKKAVEEKREYLEGWQRSRAEFANYKSQEASLMGEKEDRLKAGVVEALLPALDTLELSLRHHPDDDSLRMIERQFMDSLKRLGIERFGEAGEEFDPARHEALAKHSDDHMVASVERSGYRMGGAVIRPAQVII
jgi:molecular chaperone GrpE